MSVLLLLAGGNVGELRPERLLHLLHLLDALHRGGDPGLEHRFGAHRIEAGPQAAFDLGQHALLHRPEIGQAEEGARLLGRGGHSVYTSLRDIACRSHAMRAYGPFLAGGKPAHSTQASLWRRTARRDRSRTRAGCRRPAGRRAWTDAALRAAGARPAPRRGRD